MGYIFTFLPVIIFLLFLFLLDSFRLVRVNLLIACLAWGMVCTAFAYFLNTWAQSAMNLDDEKFSRYAAPVIEESLKALLIIILVARRRVGFLIDAAIYGFAVGTGFSLLENIWYLVGAPPETSPLNWVIRGFGTALMHGGCTSILAMILISGMNGSAKIGLAIWPGLLTAMVIHSGFNHFPVDPLMQTLLIMALLPVLFMLAFRFSNRKLHDWLEIELSNEVEIITMIRKGEFGTTKPGAYLVSIRSRFNPETVVDMYCYLSLYMELSIIAKRNLMLRESGFPITAEPDLNNKLTELANLRRQIGRLGELALAPLLRMNYRNLWKINQLKIQ
jgi:RsiW-degrading membrane proteinase PrsW (M82 family)